MDGKNLLYRLRNIIDEDSGGGWLDDRTSYDFLWEAAKEWTARTQCLTAVQELKTVANQAEYVLNADFLKLFEMNRDNRYYIKYTDLSDTFVYFRDKEDIDFENYDSTYDIQQGTLTTTATTLQDTGQDFGDWEDADTEDAAYRVVFTNTVGDESWAYLGAASTTTNTDDTVAVYTDVTLDTTGWNGAGTPSGTASHYRILKVSSQSIPSFFTIRDQQTLYDQITGTATSTTADAAGQVILTDTSGLFITTDYVNPGDVIHNTTDGSDGMVLSITSGTALVCALFSESGDNDWTTDDVYVIQPQGRIELVLDPPPSTSGHIVRVPYISRPDPVYSDYGMYRFRQHNMEAIVKFAAWLYKYRDSDPDFGNRWYKAFDSQVRRESKDLRPFIKRRLFRVNLKGRR